MRVLLLVTIATCCWALSWSQTTTPSAPQLDEVTKKCLAQEKLPLQYLVDFINEKIKPEAASQNLKCYVRCYMEGHNYLKDGQLLEANIVRDAQNITSVAMVQKIIADCRVAKGKDICETSFNIYMCINDELP